MPKPSSTIVAIVVSIMLVIAFIAAVSMIPGAGSRFLDLLSHFWRHLQLTSELPNWAFYLLGIFSILWLFKPIRKVIAYFRNKRQSYLSYVKDDYFGATWRWRYSKRDPIDIWAFCPHCDTALVYSHDGTLRGNQHTSLLCETCNRTVLTQPGDRDYLVAKVYRQIVRKLRTGEWKRPAQISNEQATGLNEK